MKILVCNHHLYELGGSEIFTFSLISELKKRGHEVFYFSYVRGQVAEKIEALGVDFYDLRKWVNLKKFDLALVSHQTLFRLKIRAKLVVQTCHGLNHPFEQPSIYADRIVAVSERVAERLLIKGYNSILIRNGVDCNRFFVRRNINSKLKNVLSLCQNEELNNRIRKVCEEFNLNYAAFSKTNTPVWNLEDKINEADLVFSLGRGAIESLACGRNVFVYDHRLGYEAYGEGIVTPANIQKLVTHNFSGSYYKKIFTKDAIIQELEKYNADYGQENRSFALEHLNIKSKVEQFLSIPLLTKKERRAKRLKIIKQYFSNALYNFKILKFEEYSEYYRIVWSKKRQIYNPRTLNKIATGKLKVVYMNKYDCHKFELAT